MSNPLIEAVEGVGKSFEEFKRVNDQRLAEEAAGNIARAKELQDTLEKISAELSNHQKNKEILEKRLAQQAERLEIVEALNDRPGKTVQDKLRDQHLELFLKWVRSGGRDNQAYQEYKSLANKAGEYKDVTIGTNIAGGFALPEQIGAAVEKLILNFSDILSEVKNIQVGTSDYKELVTIYGGNSSWVGETGTRSATNSPNLRERAPTWGELYAYPQASNFALEDIFFNVVDWLTNDIAEGQAVALSTAIYSGNGSSQPTGMTNATLVTTNDYASPMRAAAAFEYLPITSPSSPFTSSGITPDSLIDLQGLLRRGYQTNAKFAMNSITRGHVRKMKDSNNQYLWQPSMQAGTPDMLLGKPVVIWEDLGNPTTSAAFPVAYGDFKRAYLLCNRSGLAVTQEGFTTPGYTKFYVRRRYGGCPLNNDAVKFLKCSVS